MGKKEIEDRTEKFGKPKEKSRELMLLFPLFMGATLLNELFSNAKY
jgi:hypothetical protein